MKLKVETKYQYIQPLARYRCRLQWRSSWRTAFVCVERTSVELSKKTSSIILQDSSIDSWTCMTSAFGDIESRSCSASAVDGALYASSTALAVDNTTLRTSRTNFPTESSVLLTLELMVAGGLCFEADGTVACRVGLRNNFRGSVVPQLVDLEADVCLILTQL